MNVVTGEACTIGAAVKTGEVGATVVNEPSVDMFTGACATGDGVAADMIGATDMNLVSFGAAVKVVLSGIVSPN